MSSRPDWTSEYALIIHWMSDGGRAQLPGEGGDRHVQDGVVEQHGELREADDAEDQPALGVAPGGTTGDVGRVTLSCRTP